MLIEESLLQKTLNPKGNMQETTDDSDETLSLCDLPFYSDHQSVEWKQDLSAQSQGPTSISSSEQDFFEFCSQELSSANTGFPPESIIFCGKLIPHKKQQDTSEEESSKLVEAKEPTNIKKKSGWGVLREVFCLSKDHDKSTTALLHKDQAAKNMYKYDINKHGKGYDLPVHEMSILASSSSGKARWYHLFLFGVSRFSSEVELKNTKNRLGRRHCTSQPQSPTILNDGTGLTGLIRVLSCGVNQHPNTMVVASLTPKHNGCSIDGV